MGRRQQGKRTGAGVTEKDKSHTCPRQALLGPVADHRGHRVCTGRRACQGAGESDNRENSGPPPPGTTQRERARLGGRHQLLLLASHKLGHLPLPLGTHLHPPFPAPLLENQDPAGLRSRRGGAVLEPQTACSVKIRSGQVGSPRKVRILKIEQKPEKCRSSRQWYWRPVLALLALAGPSPPQRRTSREQQFPPLSVSGRRGVSALGWSVQRATLLSLRTLVLVRISGTGPASCSKPSWDVLL